MSVWGGSRSVFITLNPTLEFCFFISALKHCCLGNVEPVLKDQVQKQCLSLVASLWSASNHVYTESLTFLCKMGIMVVACFVCCRGL